MVVGLHELKCRSEYYQAVIDGRKTFELRDKKDRSFYEKDHLLLRETSNRDADEYTGRACLVEVTYILPSYLAFDGIPTNTAVMAIKLIESYQRDTASSPQTA